MRNFFLAVLLLTASICFGGGVALPPPPSAGDLADNITIIVTNGRLQSVNPASRAVSNWVAGQAYAEGAIVHYSNGVSVGWQAGITIPAGYNQYLTYPSGTNYIVPTPGTHAQWIEVWRHGTNGATGATGSSGSSGANGANGVGNITYSEWSSTVGYFTNSTTNATLVRYDNSGVVQIYQLLANSSNNAPATSTSNWRVAVSAGSGGTFVGSNYNYRGAYNAALTYTTNDSVSYNGSTFVITSTNVALGAGNAPSGLQPPEQSGMWTVFASMGNDGDTGPAGADGEDGSSVTNYTSYQTIVGTNAFYVLLGSDSNNPVAFQFVGYTGVLSMTINPTTLLTTIRIPTNFAQSGVTNLYDLNLVDSLDPSANQGLMWNGSRWTNASFGTGNGDVISTQNNTFAAAATNTFAGLLILDPSTGRIITVQSGSTNLPFNEARRGVDFQIAKPGAEWPNVEYPRGNFGLGSTIVAGMQQHIGNKAELSVILNGAGNEILSARGYCIAGMDQTHIGTGAVDTINLSTASTNNDVYSLIIGGHQNRILGTGPDSDNGGANSIGGGWQNIIGYDDTNTGVNIPAEFCVIAGGAENAIGGGSAGREAHFIGGGQGNYIGYPGKGNVVVGGMDNEMRYYGADAGDFNWSFIGGGYNNSFNGTTVASRVIVGGIGNSNIYSYGTFQGAGESNQIVDRASCSVLVGGLLNCISNATGATIGGGMSNNIFATALNATIPGGFRNQVSGEFGFAAGQQANAAHAGSFVWNDSVGTAASTAANQFIVSAQAGVFVGYTNTPVLQPMCLGIFTNANATLIVPYNVGDYYIDVGSNNVTRTFDGTTNGWRATAAGGAAVP